MYSNTMKLETRSRRKMMRTTDSQRILPKIAGVFLHLKILGKNALFLPVKPLTQAKK